MVGSISMEIMEMQNVSVTFLWSRYKEDHIVLINMDTVTVVYAAPTNHVSPLSLLL